MTNVLDSTVVELELKQGFIESSSWVRLIFISFSVIYCILYLVKVRVLHILKNRDFKMFQWESNTILLSHYSPSADRLLRGEIWALRATPVTAAIIFVIGLAIFSTMFGFTRDIWGPSKMSVLGAFRFPAELTRGKKHQILFICFHWGPSDIMPIYLFSTCLIIVSFFVYVLSSPCPGWLNWAPKSFSYASLFP